ncbi:MAG: flagella synthesis protein FlgN [Succinivibrionaceae bacterium]
MAERALIDILKAQDDILKELMTVMGEEFLLLKHRKALDLTEINHKKSELLLSLQTNDQAIKYHTEKERLNGDYRKFVEILNGKLEDCKKKNAINGRLIELNLTANRRLAASLMQIRDRNTMTYNNKGYQNALRGKHFSFEA